MASATTASAVAAVKIEGLSEAQIQVLQGIKVGDLMWFCEAIKYDDHELGEFEEAGSEDEQYGHDDEDGSAAADEHDGAVKENDDGEGLGDAEAGAADARAGMEMIEDVDVEVTSADNVAGSSHVEDGEEQNELPLDVEEYISSAQMSVAAERSSDAEGSQDEVESTTTNSEVEEEAPAPVCNKSLYLVSSIVHGKDGTIENVELVPLQYDHDLNGTDHVFRLYGKTIYPSASNNCAHKTGAACSSLKSLSQLAQNEALKNYVFDVMDANTSGDYVRAIVAPLCLCPANCTDGWLDSLEVLATQIHPTLYDSPATLAHFPLCPVCIGLDLLREQQALRATLEIMNAVDIGVAIEFTGRLNIRRAEINYGFCQFDERSWGLLFDDMVEEEDDDGSNSHAPQDGQWEHWAEAMDPSAHIQLHPASAATIAALPRVAYKEVATKHGEAKMDACLVCTTTYEPDHVVTVLPCGHFSCDGPCTVQWLSQFDTCAYCRAQVPPVEAVDGDAEDGEGEVVVSDVEMEGAAAQGMDEGGPESDPVGW